MMRINRITTISTYTSSLGLDETDGMRSAFKQVFNTKKEACDHIDKTLKKNQERKVKQEDVKFNIGVKVAFGVANVELSFGGERTRMYEDEKAELDKAIECGEVTRL